jgi:hypothetical protein
MKAYKKNLILWWMEHEQHILYAIGFVTITVGSFLFGAIHKNTFAQAPIVVYRPQNPPVVIAQKPEENENGNLTAADCKFVGSIKGTKYYPPSCSYAKKITKENLRCFTSDEDAQNKGYQRSKSCK